MCMYTQGVLTQQTLSTVVILRLLLRVPTRRMMTPPHLSFIFQGFSSPQKWLAPLSVVAPQFVLLPCASHSSSSGKKARLRNRLCRHYNQASQSSMKQLSCATCFLSFGVWGQILQEATVLHKQALALRFRLKSLELSAKLGHHAAEMQLAASSTQIVWHKLRAPILTNL